MSKFLICLAIAFFVGVQAATGVQKDAIPLPSNPQNLTEYVINVTLASFIKERQATNELPKEIFAVERKPYRYDIYLPEDLVIKVNSSSGQYYFYKTDLTLKSASTKSEYDIRIEAWTDLQNKSIYHRQDYILATVKHAIWPSIVVAYEDDILTLKANKTLSLPLINRTDIAEQVFQGGLKTQNLTNIYYKPIAHRLMEVRFSANLRRQLAAYVFEVQYVDLLTGAVHEEEVKAIFDLNQDNVLNISNTIGLSPSPQGVNVFLKPELVKFTNTTQLTYNPLVSLWNENLHRTLELRTETEIRAEARSVLKLDVTGTYRFGYDHLNAEITDKGVQFSISTSLRSRDDDHLIGVRVDLLVNPLDEEIITIHRVMDKDWYLRPSFRKPRTLDISKVYFNGKAM